MPLIDAKNTCRRRLLENDTLSTRRDFRESHVLSRLLLISGEDWILKLASQAESSMNKGGVQWECMKELQSVNEAASLCGIYYSR